MIISEAMCEGVSVVTRRLLGSIGCVADSSHVRFIPRVVRGTGAAPLGNRFGPTSVEAVKRHSDETAGTRPPSPSRLVMMAPRAGVQSTLPCIAAVLAAELENRGWRVTVLPWGRHSDGDTLARKVLSRPLDAVDTATALWSARPDVVMVHTSLDWRSVIRDLSLCVLTLRRSWKVVLMAHGSNADWLSSDSGKGAFRAAAAQLLRMCDGVLVLSKEEQEALSIASPGTPVWRVDNPFIPAPGASHTRAQHAGSSLPVVLFVGRVLREKGIFDLVQALSLDSVSPRFRLAVAGDGPDLGALLAEAERLEVTSRLVCLGRVEGDALAHAYETADLFALPTYFPEGFPRVIPEAMSYGLPIVCTDARGMRDQLVHGENALFVPPRDPAAIRTAILRLLDDHRLAEEMSRRNAQLIESYAPRRVVEAYDSVFRALCTGSAADGG
jgi:glycosyltransferase involved in cell wall biosynthesis